MQSSKDYLGDNEARVRDVEIITGLEFFTSLSVDSAIRTRTYLPSGVWWWKLCDAETFQNHVTYLNVHNIKWMDFYLWFQIHMTI